MERSADLEGAVQLYSECRLEKRTLGTLLDRPLFNTFIDQLVDMVLIKGLDKL